MRAGRLNMNAFSAAYIPGFCSFFRGFTHTYCHGGMWASMKIWNLKSSI
jgi:hypothetical protein